MNWKANILKILSTIVAKIIIWKYKPIVIAITGNVGKSSTKEAVAKVVASKYNIRYNELNYNNEFGITLTIIGVDQSGSSSKVVWFKHLLKGLKLILFRDKNYPEALVLEYGADRPNDIKRLCSIAHPDLAIVTNIGDIPVHVEFFKDIESVYTEKSNIVKMMKKTGSAILNYDNEKIYDFRKYTQGKIISYGFDNDADVHISSYKIETEDELIDSKMYIRFEYKNHFAPFEIKGVLGKGFAYAFMCAISAGVALDINLLDSLHALEDYQLLPGRLNLINGIKNSYIFNDCYNASPLAVKNSLELLNEFKDNRKIFVFGDMKELGNFTEKAHRLVAKYIIDNNVKIFVGIGEKTKFTIESLEKSDFDKNNIYHFNTSEDARLKVQDLIYPGDLILVKGSHSMKMEIISQEIAFDPDSIV